MEQTSEICFHAFIYCKTFPVPPQPCPVGRTVTSKSGVTLLSEFAFPLCSWISVCLRPWKERDLIPNLPLVPLSEELRIKHVGVHWSPSEGILGCSTYGTVVKGTQSVWTVFSQHSLENVFVIRIKNSTDWNSLGSLIFRPSTLVPSDPLVSVQQSCRCDRSFFYGVTWLEVSCLRHFWVSHLPSCLQQALK